MKLELRQKLKLNRSCIKSRTEAGPEARAQQKLNPMTKLEQKLKLQVRLKAKVKTKMIAQSAEEKLSQVG